MADLVIDNDRRLEAYCKDMADQIIHELGDEWDLYDALDAVPSWVEGDEHVIYHYKALRIASGCNVSNGQSAVEDMDMQTSNIHELATWLVHYEMEYRITHYIYEADNAR